MAFGTAPRKIKGVWYTRTGRRLSDEGQDYWDRLAAEGRTDQLGHMTRPARTAEGKASLVTKPVIVKPKPIPNPTHTQMALAQAASQGQVDRNRPDVQEAIRRTRAFNARGSTVHPGSALKTIGKILYEGTPVAAVEHAVRHPSPRSVIDANPVIGPGFESGIDTAQAARGAARRVAHGQAPSIGQGIALAGLIPFGGRSSKALKAALEAEQAAKAGSELGKAAEVGTDLARTAKTGEVLPMPSEQAQAAAAAFSGATSGAKAKMAAQGYEFGRRINKGDEAYWAEGGGRAGHYARMRALKGTYEDVPFHDLKDVSPEELDALHDEIASLPESILLEGEKNRLSKALEDAVTKNRRPQLNEIALMHKAFGKDAAAELAKTGKVPIGDVVSNILNIPRAVMASGDLSAPFRQGLMAFAMHPWLASKQLPKMFRDFVSEAHYQRGLEGIHTDPEFENSLRGGVSYTELGSRAGAREEQFGSQAAETITGVGALVGKGKGSGSIVRMSGRAYTGFLDRVRLELYKSLTAEAKAAGHDLGRMQSFRPGQRLVRNPTTLHEDIGELVNWATGRGTFKSKKLEGAAPLLNSVFFSPRLFKSRLDAVNPAFYNRLDPFARKKAMNSVVKMVTTGVGILALAKYVGGADVEIDPRSSDFGKIRFGKTRYDVWGGYQQIARMIAQEVMTPHNGEWGQWTKSSTTGEFSQPRHSFDPAIGFFENKFSPPLAFVKDLHQREMFGHKSLTLQNELKEKGIPINWQDLYDTIRSGDWKNATATGVLGSLGVGTQTYKSQEMPAKQVRRDPDTGQFVSPSHDPRLPSWAQHGAGGPSQPSRPSRSQLPSWARGGSGAPRQRGPVNDRSQLPSWAR